MDLAWRELAEALWLTAVTRGFPGADTEPDQAAEDAGKPSGSSGEAPPGGSGTARDIEHGHRDGRALDDHLHEEVVQLVPADLGGGKRPARAFVSRSSDIVRA